MSLLFSELYPESRGVGSVSSTPQSGPVHLGWAGAGEGEGGGVSRQHPQRNVVWANTAGGIDKAPFSPQPSPHAPAAFALEIGQT